MELLYLWVDKYQDGFLDSQGLNFDNRFQYQMKRKKDGSYELHIKENYNFIEDFFEPQEKSSEEIAKIKSITAIVGQNGTGKSRIIEFLKENFGTYSVAGNEEKIENYLYITREYIDDKPFHHIYFPEVMTVNIHKKIDYEHEIIKDQGLPCGLEKTTLIYFSNVYDNKEEYSVENMVNISTNHLTNNPPKKNEDSLESEGVNFKFQEAKRQIRFVYALKEEFKGFELPFKMPNKIDLFYRGRNYTVSSKRNVFEEKDKNILNSIRELYSLTSASKDSEFRLNVNPDMRNELIGFTRCILGHLYIELCEKEWINIIKNIKFTIPRKGENENDYDRLRAGLRNFASILETRSDKTELDKLITMLRSIDQLMGNFHTEYLYHKMEKSKNGMIYKFSFGIKEDDGHDFQQFMKLYEKTWINNDYIDFSWRNLSSGETALLNIYARFYFASKRIELTENTDHDLIILIDEGELYLHPHWQGKLLNILIEYFPIVFRNSHKKKQRNVQLILTSNSPFVVSDLPSTNIIFLKKEMEKSVVIDSLEEYHQTFAANIHSLLAHSFFMEDGVTGTFANRKINEIIELLVNEDINKILQNEKKIEKTINLIGEPLIRHKLAQMLSDKLSIRILSAEREIEKLKSRLKELESSKNDTNKA
ncbi:AAA family ATPase [Bacillus pacificus]|uniref:AAA family ATPase n=1 Tax=Bacillus pacificus TaxID=2026187 RepID=UPI003D1EC4ED